MYNTYHLSYNYQLAMIKYNSRRVPFILRALKVASPLRIKIRDGMVLHFHVSLRDGL
jgi:hypothetical protein